MARNQLSTLTCEDKMPPKKLKQLSLTTTLFSKNVTPAPSEDKASSSSSSEEDNSPVPGPAITRPTSPHAATTTTRRRKFPQTWLKKYIWMGYDEISNEMYCKICREHGAQGQWTTGTNNFRLRSVTDHMASREHRTAVSANDPDQSCVSKAAKKAKEEREKSVLLALKTCYWVAKEEMPNLKYKSLLAFLRHIEVPEAIRLCKSGNVKYDSSVIFDQLLLELSSVIEHKLKIDLHNSPFIGVGIDESTDRSLEKHLVIVVRYIKNNKANTTFLKCVKIVDGTAANIYSAVKDVLTEYDVSLSKVAGLGTDGASVMSGHIAGVNALIKADNPFCIFVHCVCHRLNLAVSQACKSNGDMSTLHEIISAIYNYIQGSANRQQQFKEISAVLDEDTVKFQRIFDIRWLSVGNAIQAVLRNYQSLMVYLSQDAAKGIPVAIGLYQQLTKYKFVALLHLAADILNATNHLSKVFQYRDIAFSSVGPALEDCRNILQGFLVHDGPHLGQFHVELEAEPALTFKGTHMNVTPERAGTQRQLFARTRQSLIEAILNNIEERFPQTTIINSMQIFDPRSYQFDQLIIDRWGIDHLNTLLEHYGKEMPSANGQYLPPVVNPDTCRAEFLPFKRLVHRLNRENELLFGAGELLTKLFGGPLGDVNRDQYAELYKLLCCVMCVMVGNAESERIFSVQNRIKSHLRSSLSITHLDKLIRLSYNNIDLEDFEFREALDGFFTAGNRRI